MATKTSNSKAKSKPSTLAHTAHASVHAPKRETVEEIVARIIRERQATESLQVPATTPIAEPDQPERRVRRKKKQRIKKSRDATVLVKIYEAGRVKSTRMTKDRFYETYGEEFRNVRFRYAEGEHQCLLGRVNGTYKLINPRPIIETHNTTPDELYILNDWGFAVDHKRPPKTLLQKIKVGLMLALVVIMIIAIFVIGAAVAEG